MQVYRGMDIGTAKPTESERRGVVHHMIDVADPAEDFSVARFREMGRSVIANAQKPLVIAGGSGLHFRALVDRMSFAPTDPEIREELEAEDPDQLVARLLEADPTAAEHVDLANPRRVIRAVEILELTGATPSQRAGSEEAGEYRSYSPEIPFIAAAVDPGAGLDHRVDLRLEAMRDRGLVDEVRALWPRMGRTARGAVGYREIGAYLEGQLSLDKAFAEAGKATRKLARRQRTWFRRDPRIGWIAWSDDPAERFGRVMEALT